MEKNLSPKQIVEQLDQYIIGQTNAKKSVAVALRNRYRRMQLDEALREEIVPKNILMIGPTGVGKTEIARRLAKLVDAPFIKIEATKDAEVGYVGRDVESMVRDLVEMSIRMVKEEKMKDVQEKAKDDANKKLVKLLVPEEKKQTQTKNPFEMLFNNQVSDEDDDDTKPEKEEIRNKRKRIAHQLALGELEDHNVTIEVEEQNDQLFNMLQGSGMEQMGMNMNDALGSFMPKKKKKRRLPVKEARKILTTEAAHKLIDMDEVSDEAIYRAERSGIIFSIIDKIAVKREQITNVCREGVPRDIFLIGGGSTISTKHGTVKKEHMLFIAAGAFHMSKPSDLSPELQGRFPIRVELDKLSVNDFERILKEPSNALLKQYTALIETEGIQIVFKEEAITRIAEIAFE